MKRRIALTLLVVLTIVGVNGAILIAGSNRGENATALANPELASFSYAACNSTQVYSDPGDANAAAALAADGYSCTALLNKGRLPSTHERVGELWYKQDGAVLQSRVIIFGGVNTGFTEPKLCLDDDTDPISSIAKYCDGSDAPLKFQQGFNGGPSYPPAKDANTAPEEGAGLFEIIVENPVEVSGTFGGTTVGGWNINIDGYNEVLPHFNWGDLSIVAYFQPWQPATPTPTATSTSTPTATPTNTATAVNTATPVNTATAVNTATPVTTATAVSTATAVNTATAVSTATAVNTATPISTVVAGVTAVPTSTASIQNTATPSPSETAVVNSPPAPAATATSVPEMPGLLATTTSITVSASETGVNTSAAPVVEEKASTLPNTGDTPLDLGLLTSLGLGLVALGLGFRRLSHTRL